MKNIGVFVAGVPLSLAPRTPFCSRILAPLPLPHLHLLRRLVCLVHLWLCKKSTLDSRPFQDTWWCDLVGVRSRVGLLTGCTGNFTAFLPSCYAVLMSSKKSETAEPCSVEVLGGSTSRRFGWGCAVRFSKPLPYFRPKYVISLPYFRPDRKFDTLFQTSPYPYFVCVNIWAGLQTPNVNQTSVLWRRKVIKR